METQSEGSTTTNKGNEEHLETKEQEKSEHHKH